MSALINVNIPYSIIGPGSIKQIGNILKKLAPTRLLLVTDTGVVNAGLLKPVKSILDTGGLKFDVFLDCKPEAPISVINRLARYIKDEKFGLILGIGGGSTMDTAKIAAIIAHSDLKVLDLRNGRQAEKVVPKILIPTTAGTGSEWSNVAVVTDDTKGEPGQTTVIITPQNFADAAIIDPEFTYDLPPRVTADTGMDALTHAIEAYTSPVGNGMSEMFAETAIKLTSESLRDAFANGSRNTNARSNMSLAASLAMHAVVLSSAGLAHFMNEPLGKKARLSHGATCTLLLPSIMEFYLPANEAKYAHIAGFMGENTDGLTNSKAAVKSIEAVKKLARDIEMPSKAKVEISDKEIDALVEELFVMEGPVIKLFSPREVGKAEASRIYHKILR